MNSFDKEKCVCSKCSNEYLFDIVGKYKNVIFNVELGADEITVYYILKCPGCAGITFKYKNVLSFNNDSIEEDEIMLIEYYPKYRHEFSSDIFLSDKSLKKDKNFIVLMNLIREIRLAIDNEQYMLAAMGQRSLIDVVCKILLGDNDNNFIKNIQACVDLGFISKKHYEILSPVLDFGHSAVHRGLIPEKYDVLMTMRIILNMIDTYLVHINHIQRLKDKLPSRKRPKKENPPSQ